MYTLSLLNTDPKYISGEQAPGLYAIWTVKATEFDMECSTDACSVYLLFVVLFIHLRLHWCCNLHGWEFLMNMNMSFHLEHMWITVHPICWIKVGHKHESGFWLWQVSHEFGHILPGAHLSHLCSRAAAKVTRSGLSVSCWLDTGQTSSKNWTQKRAAAVTYI